MLPECTCDGPNPLRRHRLRWVDDASVHRLMMIHGSLVNALYVLVPLHLLGVALASVQHRENLVRAMITGYKSTNTNER